MRYFHPFISPFAPRGLVLAAAPCRSVEAAVTSILQTAGGAKSFGRFDGEAE